MKDLKIIQIIPAPADLYIEYTDIRNFNSRVACLALVEEIDPILGAVRSVVPMDCCEDSIDLASSNMNSVFFEEDRQNSRIKLENLEMSIRVTTCLKNYGFIYLDEVAKKTNRELLRVPNLGKGSIDEIRNIIIEYL